MKRRAFLRGAGSVAVALPFMNELMTPVARAADDPPTRLVTLFFGLGLDPDWQRDFNGPLEPYRSLSGKMAMCSANLGQGSSGGAHCNTSTVVFVGEKQSSVNVAGGPSIDQAVRNALDPSAPTLASGLWWRRGACDAQALRVYNPDGSSRSPVKRPSEVFDTLFGSVQPIPPSEEVDPAERRRARIARSVLDTVMDQVRHYTGDASPLGRTSKLKLEQHLNAIREIELELAPADAIIDAGEGPPVGPVCEAGNAPSDPDIADYDRFTYGTGNGAPTIDWRDVQQVFRLHADLWALALRCDRVRYGNLMFESAGGHTNLTGTYQALGDSTDFPGSSQHDSYFHDNDKRRAQLYQHFAQTQLAYFLQQLDDPAHLEGNGRTVLDNTTVVIGTEYGWNHSKEQAFHAVAGGGGRFKSGFFVDRTVNCIDVYNAVLRGHGLQGNIGQATGVDSEGSGDFLLA